jgi:hypothetical protein
MSYRSRSLVFGLIALATWGLGACGDQASGETSAGGARPASKTKSFCPSATDMGAAAGFDVSMTASVGSSPDRWVMCQYEMTGRYRGNFVEVSGQPASKADSVFGDIKRAVKGMRGVNAEADRLDLGSGGLAYGSNSLSEAAAVVGNHVYHARMEYMGFNTIGDQKDAMVRVLKLVAH